MGAALANAALDAGHEVTVISGPVNIAYPQQARVVWVETTEQMLAAAEAEFDHCDGCIGAAAPCDYRPQQVAPHKLAKTGEPLVLHLVETADVIATLGQSKRPDQWVVGFALETDDHRFRAITKLERKHCDLMVSNDPTAIDSDHNSVELLAPDGTLLVSIEGTKEFVAIRLIAEIDHRLNR
jgi:phosphopantothenoylcysteine decarboxylase/phosphopantothenate--cysteine ligase